MSEKHANPDILRLNRNLNAGKKTPFGYTLLGGATACFAFWSVALNQIEYVGTLAFMGLQLCLACWLIIGVVNLINRVRQAFTFASYDLADFAAGKAQAKKPTQKPTLAHGDGGKFYNAAKAAMTAQIAAENEARALRRDLEAK